MENRKKTLFAIYFAYFLDYFGYAIVFGLFGPLVLNTDFHMFSDDTPLQIPPSFLGSSLCCISLDAAAICSCLWRYCRPFRKEKDVLYFREWCHSGIFFLGRCDLLPPLFAPISESRFNRNVSPVTVRFVWLPFQTYIKMKWGVPRAYGIIATLGGLSWIVSILVGGIFSKALSPEIPFWITTGFSPC